mmetsp:Transcript_13039/g.51998  ORF Transcript_13039/g.51998 Transcript_13039/m.51998 type:complete len:230 (+) Transcript_13039:288-977(+)
MPGSRERQRSSGRTALFACFECTKSRPERKRRTAWFLPSALLALSTRACAPAISPLVSSGITAWTTTRTLLFRDTSFAPMASSAFLAAAFVPLCASCRATVAANALTEDGHSEIAPVSNSSASLYLSAAMLHCAKATIAAHFSSPASAMAIASFASALAVSLSFARRREPDSSRVSWSNVLGDTVAGANWRALDAASAAAVALSLSESSCARENSASARRCQAANVAGE